MTIPASNYLFNSKGSNVPHISFVRLKRLFTIICLIWPLVMRVINIIFKSLGSRVPPCQKAIQDQNCFFSHFFQLKKLYSNFAGSSSINSWFGPKWLCCVTNSRQSMAIDMTHSTSVIFFWMLLCVCLSINNRSKVNYGINEDASEQRSTDVHSIHGSSKIIHKQKQWNWMVSTSKWGQYSEERQKKNERKTTVNEMQTAQDTENHTDNECVIFPSFR